MISIGSVIGSGIFLTPALIAGHLPSAPWILLVWVLGGCLALAGALTFSELAGMLPRAGGVYVGPALNRLTYKPPPLPPGVEGEAQLRSDQIRVDIPSDWAEDGMVYWQTDDPLPFTLLGVTLDFKHGGR